MFVIFLDIDGVLNSEMFARNRERGDRSKIDPFAVGNLNRLISVFDAKIVVSSSWKSIGLEGIKQVLEDHGVEGEVIDITPSISSFAICEDERSKATDIPRGVEIREWIKMNTKMLGVQHHHQFKDYLILDDDADMLLEQQFNFFQTNRFCGLDPHTVTDILAHFGYSYFEA